MSGPEHRESLLETEFRIIASNEKHVVVAVRIEKKSLGKNLMFLAAIIDQAISSDTEAATSKALAKQAN